MKSSFAVIFLALAACTDPAGDDAVTDGDAPQQFVPGSDGKGDSATLSKDPRIVSCHLEYEAFLPVFTTRPAGDFETTFGEIENRGAVAGDGKVALELGTNPHPPHNLSFIAQIVDSSTHLPVSYIVLPRPHVGGAFLFELGAVIPPVTIDDAQFTVVRAYCSIRMP